MVRRKNVYQAECCEFSSESRREVIEHEKLHAAFDEMAKSDGVIEIDSTESMETLVSC